MSLDVPWTSWSGCRPDVTLAMLTASRNGRICCVVSATGGAATPGRERLTNATLGLIFLVLSTLGAEAALRWAVPWLVPGASGYSRQTGLPSGWLEQSVEDLRQGAPELVFVGDSFVLSGLQPRGFISTLRQLTGRRIGGLGANGACPSQYWLMSDAVRRAGIDVPIVVVLFIGNDFADEAVWASLGPDRSFYEPARLDHYSDPARPSYWPCFQVRPGLDRPWARMTHALQRHSALYRASRLALGGAFGEEGVARYMRAECDRAPWAERVGDRLFFFRQHDASVDPRDTSLADAQASILDALAKRVDSRFYIAPVLDREESCAGFHGRTVNLAAPFIEKLRARGLKVLDANPELARACAERQLFVSDGHWNMDGQDVFSQALLPLLSQEGLLPRVSLLAVP